MIDLSTATLCWARDLLHARSISVTELIEATLARIEETEPIVHAYVHVSAERALEAARAADRRPNNSPLRGIPFGAKDVLVTTDAPTAAGSRILEGTMSGQDAVAIRRLREAGAILVGKHYTQEFAFGQDKPPTRNPWNLDHYPGGSSVGGGVSVAVGSSLTALGTDAGGSLRKPAALTATVGLKPTYGRVSSHGTVPTASAPSLDHVGIFTRTVADLALVLQVVAGPDPADPYALDDPVPDYSKALAETVGGLRIGLAEDAFFGPELRDDVRVLVRAALDVLGQLGVSFVDVDLPSVRRLTVPAGVTISLSEVAARHRPWLIARPDEYFPGTRQGLEFGLLIPAMQVDLAQRARGVIREEVRRAFRDLRLDALVMPTLPRTSMSFQDMDLAVDLDSFVPYTFPWNLTGQPALSVPCGFTPEGLPAALQIVGRPLDEETVLRLGHAYEQATPWHERHPTLRASD